MGDVVLTRMMTVERNFLREINDGKWRAFFHGANKLATAMHEHGLLDRRPWDRPEGGYQYRISEAGRSEIA